METTDKILVFQVIFLFINHFLIHPDSPITPFLERLFGSYNNVLAFVTGGQALLIVFHLLWKLWLFL